MSTAKRPGAQIFRFTRVKLKIYPPSITLKQKLEMVYSFIYIYILSLYVVSHLELSKWTGQSCSVNFFMILLCCCCVLHDNIYMLLLLLLLLLLCITRQHIYVVVVVVIVYFYWSFVSISRNKRALFVK